LLRPHVDQVVVCNPRKNALLKEGNKSDRVDARKLAELLRAGLLSPVYHGENGVRRLKELARSYLVLSQDLTRVMNRLKALYRSWAIPCSGQTVYAPRHRAAWLEKLPESSVRRCAERLYQQLDQLQPLRQQARQELVAESRKHGAAKWLRQVPYIGPLRAALLIARWCKLRSGSAPSASCGPIAAWRCGPAAALTIDFRRGSCSVRRNRRLCAASMRTTITN
jgi:transposase